MHVAFERGTVKAGWFGGHDPVLKVTITFNEEEKEIIRGSPFLGDHVVFESPRAESAAEQGIIEDRSEWQARVKHFIEQSTRQFSPDPEGEAGYAYIQDQVEKNLRSLKEIMSGISKPRPDKIEI